MLFLFKASNGRWLRSAPLRVLPSTSFQAKYIKIKSGSRSSRCTVRSAQKGYDHPRQMRPRAGASDGSTNDNGCGLQQLTALINWSGLLSLSEIFLKVQSKIFVLIRRMMLCTSYLTNQGRGPFRYKTGGNATTLENVHGS